MQDDINQEITFRKLSVFMMFMAKGNIARTAEAMKLSSVSVHRALHTLEEGVGWPRCLFTKGAQFTAAAGGMDAAGILSGCDESDEPGA